MEYSHIRKNVIQIFFFLLRVMYNIDYNIQFDYNILKRHSSFNVPLILVA